MGHLPVIMATGYVGFEQSVMIIGWNGAGNMSGEVAVFLYNPQHVTTWHKVCHINAPGQTGIALRAGGPVDPVLNTAKTSNGKSVMALRIV